MLWKYVTIVIAASFLAYLPFIPNKLFWDDEQFIYNNAYVKNFAVGKIFTTNTIAGAGELSNYYRPLTTTSFAIDYQFWGTNPIGFHLTNTLLHTSAAAVVLLFVLLSLGLPTWPSFIIAVIFAIHPIQTEAVAYANSRGDSLYTLFGLLSIFTFLSVLKKKSFRFRIYDLVLNISQPMLIALTCLLYLCSILSKEIGIAIGALFFMILCKTYIEARKSPRLFLMQQKMSVLTITASALIAATYLILRFSLLKFQPMLNLYGESSYGTSVLVRLLTFTKAIWIYIRLLLFPYPLHMERGVEVVESLISIWTLLIISLAVTLVFLAIKEWRQKRTIYIFTGASWFFILLLPVSGIFPVNGMLYEHWLYLPMVGFFLCIYGIYKLFFKAHANIVAANFLIPLACILLLLTWRQNYIWNNPIRFYTYTLKYADTARLHNNLAMAYAESTQLESAIEHYQKAIAIDDSYPQTFHNLGNAYRDNGDLEHAFSSYQNALAVNKSFYPSHIAIIKLLAQQEKYKEAVLAIDDALLMFPNDERLVSARSELMSR